MKQRIESESDTQGHRQNLNFVKHRMMSWVKISCECAVFNSVFMILKFLQKKIVDQLKSKFF